MNKFHSMHMWKAKTPIFYYRFVNTFSFSFSSPRFLFFPFDRLSDEVNTHIRIDIAQERTQDQCAERCYSARAPNEPNAQPVCLNLLCISLSRQFSQYALALVFTKDIVRAANTQLFFVQTSIDFHSNDYDPMDFCAQHAKHRHMRVWQMAKEHCDGANVDLRTRVYRLKVEAIFWALSEKQPFSKPV